jgi:uncharacterized protein YidB (DUF937 family)
MPTNRKLLGAAAFSLALAGGGVAGALFGTPSFSGAQDDTSSTTDTTTAAPEAGRPFGDHGERLAAAAEALGIPEADLRTALEGGQSIAQVAETQGVDIQTVIDALVAEATDRLHELEASLPARMTELVNKEGLGDHEGPGRGGPGGHHLGGARLDAAAEAIGITTDELRTALEDGSTIAAVSEAHGVDVQTVIDAMVAEATTQIDAAVADGSLDAARAEQMKATLVERITAHVNGERPARGPGGEAPPADDAA